MPDGRHARTTGILSADRSARHICRTCVAPVTKLAAAAPGHPDRTSSGSGTAEAAAGGTAEGPRRVGSGIRAAAARGWRAGQRAEDARRQRSVGRPVCRACRPVSTGAAHHQRPHNGHTARIRQLTEAHSGPTAAHSDPTVAHSGSVTSQQPHSRQTAARRWLIAARSWLRAARS